MPSVPIDRSDAPAALLSPALVQRCRRAWHGRDVAIVYAAVVLVVGVVIALMPEAQLDRIVTSSSTNLDNLRHRPLYVLFVSAFVVSPAWGLVILVPLVAFYGAVQRWLGRASTVVIALLGHIGATLFVATMEASQLTRSRAGFAITRDADVGVSYGIATLMGLLIARVPPVWRRRYLAGCAVVMAAQLILVQGFTALGHITAWVVGMAIALPILRAQTSLPAQD